MIEIKPKPCKGIGKAFGFKGCGTMQLIRTYGLGVNCGCYRDWLMNTEEGNKKVKRMIIKVAEPRESLEKAKEVHRETNGIQTALETTRKAVHNMINLRDRGKPCISCGCQWSDTAEAGHFHPTRARSIRFDFFNINSQCFECNNLKGGNEAQYALRLPDRIGQEQFDKLQARAALDKKFNKHWSKTELSEIRKKAREIIKELTN